MTSQRFRSAKLVSSSLFSLFFMFGLPPQRLHAQTQTTTPPTQQKAEDQKPKVTEEVTVTARKREEQIEEIPISVAAPTEAELRDRGADDIEDIAANVAGFTVQNLGPGQSQVAM